MTTETAAMDGTKKEHPTTFYLSKEERLELQNINLRRQMLEVQVQQQVQTIESEQRTLVAAINARLGTDISAYKVNLQTGECTREKEATEN